MKAYKVELLVLGFENLSEDDLRHYLSNVKHVYPTIIDVKEAEIGEWTDDHPLNKTTKEEYHRLFNI